MYVMCVILYLFRVLSRSVDALQICIIIIINVVKVTQRKEESPMEKNKIKFGAGSGGVSAAVQRSSETDEISGVCDSSDQSRKHIQKVQEICYNQTT